MGEDGKVISITGFDPVYSKIAASAGAAIKDAKQKNGFRKQF